MSVLNAGGVQAQGENDQELFTQLLNKIDTSITVLRKDQFEDTTGLLNRAKTIYDNAFSARVDNSDNAKITAAFNSLTQTSITQETKAEVEENIFALRANIYRAVSSIGVSLPPLYEYSLFIILGIGMIISLLITLVNKRLVNWDQVREYKARIAEFQKELREAQSRRDMKHLHKIKERQGEMLSLQKKVFTQTFKPTIIYLVPLLLLWMVLLNVFRGWVVAWLPFRIDLPIFGPLVAFGVGWWYFLTYLGFSQIWRKILIRD